VPGPTALSVPGLNAPSVSGEKAPRLSAASAPANTANTAAHLTPSGVHNVAPTPDPAAPLKQPTPSALTPGQQGALTPSGKADVAAPGVPVRRAALGNQHPDPREKPGDVGSYVAAAAATAATAAAPAPGPTAVTAAAPAPAPAAAPETGPAAQPALEAALTGMRTRPSGTHELTVQLHPADLGAVRVVAKLSGDQLDVTVLCADHAAQQAVAAAVPALREQLGELRHLDLALPGSGGTPHQAPGSFGDASQRPPQGGGDRRPAPLADRTAAPAEAPDPRPQRRPAMADARFDRRI
jgi:flagellar hook-length control protein FliK